ncbi:hypothetical protein PVAP13_9NG796600 [Panicum virgatum]|uniref:Uncharacterized protein n=1 Tax=Panicum virgatum TaxID=38727 RepID=A0A8T0N3V1_PANVG|nr:hypothetical protein PVAP13_9NG796600 [Panicum virgatum]
MRGRFRHVFGQQPSGRHAAVLGAEISRCLSGPSLKRDLGSRRGNSVVTVTLIKSHSKTRRICFFFLKSLVGEVSHCTAARHGSRPGLGLAGHGQAEIRAGFKGQTS